MVQGSFAHSSPFRGSWLERLYRGVAPCVYPVKIRSDLEFSELIETYRVFPELLIESNFIPGRFGVHALCRELGINRITSEDGFFPHYLTIHADPVGFCWESSLSKMSFWRCTDKQRRAARHARADWLQFEIRELPDCVQPPFVLWPLQLIGDNVNRWDAFFPSWIEVIRHFRACLPSEFQLILKHHPRAKAQDFAGIEELVSELPNTCLIDDGADLKTLLSRCAAVAGVNSTVLTEARVMFLKPVYAYGRSWYSSHDALITPMNHRTPTRLPECFEHVVHPEKQDEWLRDYVDWYLYQLLSRQLSRKVAESDPAYLKRFVDRLSYHSFLRYGEAIFD